jgi:uncharacterized protein YutE (UPF0331/DUF86 family)
VVDETRVQRLLRAVADDLAVLRSAAAASPEQRSEPLWMRGVKYTFVTAIEACIDVHSTFVLQKVGDRLGTTLTPFALLGDHKVVDRELAVRMRRAAGFRNVLVHKYIQVDDRIVLAMLNDPSDLHQFSRQVAAWLGGN